MKCPQCQTPLVMSERQGVEIDYCPQCRGVWLDRGELDKIIERSSSYEERDEHQAPPPQPYGGHDQSRYYKQHKKKSFWSELFD